MVYYVPFFGLYYCMNVSTINLARQTYFIKRTLKYNWCAIKPLTSYKPPASEDDWRIRRILLRPSNSGPAIKIWDLNGISYLGGEAKRRQLNPTMSNCGQTIRPNKCLLSSNTQPINQTFSLVCLCNKLKTFTDRLDNI